MSAQTLLLPSWSSVLPRQTRSVPVLETLPSRAISADIHKNRWRKKIRRWSSTLISYSTTFSNSSSVSMDETWTWSEFCFLWNVAFPGEVACGTWWGPFLAATLPWGRGQCNKATKLVFSFLMWQLKASYNCSPSLNLYCLGPELLRVWQKRRYWKCVLWLGIYSCAGGESLGR